MVDKANRRITVGVRLERSKKMCGSFRMYLVTGVVLALVFGLVGCKDAEKERALAEVEALKVQLAETTKKLDEFKVELEKERLEKKTLNSQVGTLSGTIESLKTQVTSITEARDKFQALAGQAGSLKEQLAQLTSEKDSAVAKVADLQGLMGGLRGQLDDQTEKAEGLEEENSKLQKLLDELKKFKLPEL